MNCSAIQHENTTRGHVAYVINNKC